MTRIVGTSRVWRRRLVHPPSLLYYEESVRRYHHLISNESTSSASREEDDTDMQGRHAAPTRHGQPVVLSCNLQGKDAVVRGGHVGQADPGLGTEGEGKEIIRLAIWRMALSGQFLPLQLSGAHLDRRPSAPLVLIGNDFSARPALPSQRSGCTAGSSWRVGTVGACF